MRHGNFHNSDCKYCQVMDKMVWSIIFIAVIVFEYCAITGLGDFSKADRLDIIVTIPIVLVISILVQKLVNKTLPQSHGYLFDMTGETKWYKPRSSNVTNKTI